MLGFMMLDIVGVETNYKCSVGPIREGHSGLGGAIEPDRMYDVGI